MARAKIELHLPGLTVGVDNIQVTGFGRRFGRKKPAGPYLITNRSSGLALDTAHQWDLGSRVATWPPHAHPHQLWYLRPSGIQGEVTIISAANSLALDSTRETSSDVRPLMEEPNGETWQRWRLEATADGIGYLIKSPHSGNYLTLTEEARNHLDGPWAPWFSPREGKSSQQWIFSLPYGNV